MCVKTKVVALSSTNFEKNYHILQKIIISNILFELLTIIVFSQKILFQYNYEKLK